MTSTTTTESPGPMASLIAWAADTFGSPQAAVASAAYHMLGAGTYGMGVDIPADGYDIPSYVKSTDLPAVFAQYGAAAAEVPTVEAMVLGHSYTVARFF